MKKTEGINEEEDEDDVPDLVNQNFEEESKKVEWNLSLIYIKFNLNLF